MTAHKVFRGWQKSGSLFVGNTAVILPMQVNFPDPGYYTLQFSANPKNPPISFKAVADITWSVEGNQISRRVSIQNGMTISGPGQAVTLRMRDVSGAGTAWDGQQYDVTAQVTRGSRPTSAAPPLLFERNSFGVAAGGSAVAVQVPQNVGINSVLVAVSQQLFATAGTPQNVSVAQQDPSGGVLFFWNPVVNPGFIPILPGVTQLTIENDDTAKNAEVSVVWGIDG